MRNPLVSAAVELRVSGVTYQIFALAPGWGFIPEAWSGSGLRLVSVWGSPDHEVVRFEPPMVAAADGDQVVDVRSPAVAMPLLGCGVARIGASGRRFRSIPRPVRLLRGVGLRCRGAGCGLARGGGRSGRRSFRPTWCPGRVFRGCGGVGDRPRIISTCPSGSVPSHNAYRGYEDELGWRPWP